MWSVTDLAGEMSDVSLETRCQQRTCSGLGSWRSIAWWPELMTLISASILSSHPAGTSHSLTTRHRYQVSDGTGSRQHHNRQGRSRPQSSGGAPGIERGHEDQSAEDAEWGGVRRSVPSQPTRCLGERREFPQSGPGRAPTGNAFLTYFGVTEHYW